jgi:IS30 family transposase
MVPEIRGIPPAMFGQSAKPLSGRYLSFAEREEVALLRAQGYSTREVALRLGRAASTISRELRRNAATRSGGLEYRATTARASLALVRNRCLCVWRERRIGDGAAQQIERLLERAVILLVRRNVGL